MSATEIPRAMLAAAQPRQVEDVADLRRRLRQLRYLIFHPLAHRRYIKEVAGYIDRGLMCDGVFQRYKYLGDYFARSLSRSERRTMILSHYRFVERRVTGSAFSALTSDGIRLWQRPIDQHRAMILLTHGEFAPMEGEWQLQFLLDGAIISTLSFVFASGSPCMPGAEVVCLIGGVQGGSDCRHAIRIAAKGNDEIAPTTMLILATKAIAQALGVDAVFGVSSEQQIVRLVAADRMKADYDAIWTSEGASRCIGGFYPLSHDLAERELSAIPRTHRRRTRLKRERKAAILAGIAAEARTTLLGRPTMAAQLH